MARLDKIHDAVKSALIKDGWSITAEPLRLEFEKVNLLIDLAAEKVLVAEKDGRKIAVEIKSFLDPSLLNNLKDAIGQYEIYLFYLHELEPDRKLYIAIGDAARARLLALTGIEMFLEEKKVPFIVVNIETEEVVEWIN